MAARTSQRSTGSRKQGFTRDQLARVRDTAARTVRTANLRIAENAGFLERWRKGEVPEDDKDWWWGRVLDVLDRTGDLPRAEGGWVEGGVQTRIRRRFGAKPHPAAMTSLFPSVAEKGAAAVLLICHEAWNLSVLKKMKVPDQFPNGDGDAEEPVIQRVATDKPRRRSRRHATNSLVNLGENTPGWALQQVVRMTEPVRQVRARLGRPTPALLLSRSCRGDRSGELFTDGTVALDSAISWWAAAMREKGIDLPDRLHAQILRHSAQVLHGSPRNNTRRVQEDAYERKDEQVIQDSQDVVAAGLATAVEHAQAQVRMKVIEAVAQATAEEVADQADLPLAVARQVVDGDLDTAVAACLDFEHSPFTPSGPCAVSFLLCFACPNALATGRHLPRIVYLFQSVETLRSAVSPAVWAADWRDHHARIGHLLSQHTDPVRWPELLATLSDRDKELVERMLQRRLDS